MEDRGGSGMQVPILGAEKDKATGAILPLGGTMEDPEGEGSVPIMIGKQAVDPITGDLGPVSGVKINPETATVVPVTLSSGGHRKRKPPLGATAMLEEEVVARRSYWRRQRQREDTLTQHEFLLSQQLIHNIETATAKKVESALSAMSEATHEMTEAAKREVQRRADSEQEFAAVLPPDVVAVLTEGDQYEREREDRHLTAHKKFVETTQKFLKKLEAEEHKFRDKMMELEDAMNPDAENVAKQRHAQAKGRLQNELQDQIITRTVGLDEEHSVLEYARERNELLCQEAKTVLVGSAFLAGDYDCILSGVYGDLDLTCSTSDRELIPLLKQLIGMLEGGGPFTLSAELINLLGGGNVLNMNINQGGFDVPSVQIQDVPQEPIRQHMGTTIIQQPIEQTKPLQRAPTVVTDDTGVSALTNADAFKQPTNDDDRRRMTKWLFEKQAFEAAQLENRLRGEEISEINQTISKFDAKKNEVIQTMKEDLAAQLKNVKNEDERDRIMMEFANNMQRLNDAIEKQKQEQMDKLRKQLLERRRQAKKELHKAHISEAKKLKVPVDVVPDMTIPTHDDLDHDLRLLAQQQAALIAELQKAQAEEDAKGNDVDPEFEARLKALHFGGVDSAEVNELEKKLKDKSSQTKNTENRLKEKLKNRKKKTRTKASDVENINNLNEDEKKKILETQEMQEEADRLKEEQAIIEAMKILEQDALERKEKEELERLLKNKTEDERNKILAQHAEDCANLDSKLKDQKDAQKDALLAKIKARKRMREELTKENAVAAELDRITRSQASKGDLESAEVIIDITAQLGETESEEQKRLHDEQIERQAKLEEKLKEEERNANREMDKALQDGIRMVNEDIDQQKKMAVDNSQIKFDREMQLHGKKLNEAEYEKLMAAHRAEVETLQKNMELERNRQKGSLADKIAERKKKKEQLLAEKAEVELNKELMRQQQERDELNMKRAKDVEQTALKDSIKDKTGEQAENIIYTVLRQRHMKEAVHLEEQLDRELKAGKEEAKAKMAEKRQHEREKLTAAFEQELLELTANSSSLKSGELVQKKDELKRQQERNLREFDNLTPQMIARAERDVEPELEVKHINARLDLKERQLKELADAMRTYSPQDILLKQYEEDAEKARNELNNYRQNTMLKMQQELERRKEEQKQREEEKKKKMKESLKKLEADLEADRKREEEREKRRQAEREKLHNKQIEERNKKQKEEIDQMKVSADEKERLFREHEENMKKFEDSLHKEQARSKSSLAARLEERRNRKRAIESARLDRDLQLEEEEINRADLKQAHTDDIKQKKESDTVITEGSLPFTPSGNMEQDWVSMLMASPLFQQINDLEKLVESSVGTAGPSKRVIGADYDQYYIDTKDAQWVCSGDLVPVDLNDITPHQFVIYRFGVFVAKVLHTMVQAPDITLLLASNLPPNNYENNAFRHSFFYEHARKILFIRQERLESVGDFLVVILHCLSHIKVDELTDDNNPIFLRQFYKSLTVVCKDMFFARSRSSPITNQLTGSELANRRTVIETAFKTAKTPDERANVIGELMNIKVIGPISNDFSDESLSDRIGGYEDVSTNAKLRQMLMGKGGISTTSDFVAARLSELKGSVLKESKRPVTITSKVSTIRNSRDLIESQLKEMQNRCDAYTGDLAQVMKTEADIAESLKKSPDEVKMKLLHSQQATVCDQKDATLRKIAHLEGDITKKQKELLEAK